MQGSTITSLKKLSMPLTLAARTGYSVSSGTSLVPSEAHSVLHSYWVRSRQSSSAEDIAAQSGPVAKRDGE